MCVARHYVETSHTFALQVSDSRVWDYAGDNYVHRLVQNKGDGKLVEVDEHGDDMPDEKLDNMQMEVRLMTLDSGVYRYIL